MKRRTVLKSAALVPALALPLALPIRKPGHMLIAGYETIFYDDGGHQIARVCKDGRVVREAGVTSRCARIFWESLERDADIRLVGGRWPLAVSIDNGSEPAWSVDMPANGSIAKMKFKNVDPAAKFFWSMIQAARPAALTWS